MINQPLLDIENSLDFCIKCNICVTKCPVIAVTDLFPGPKYEGPQGTRFRKPGQLSPDQSVDYCSGCRVCNMVCPTGVKIAELNARARARMVEQWKIPIVHRIRNNILARSELLGKILQPIAPIANWMLSNPLARKLAENILEIHEDAPLPPIASQRFTDWFERRKGSAYKSDSKVVYFHGCSTQYYEPRIGQAAVYVLEANGFEVIVPPQNCCGLPLLSNGEFKAAYKYHMSNVHKLIPYVRQGIPIVGTSTSCTLTLKEEAPELLDLYGDEEVALIATYTFDICEFLMYLYEKGTLNTNFQPLPLSLVYHAPCQYRAHRIGFPSLDILNLIPELKITPSHSDCCGIAGTYGYKKEKYPIAMDVGKSLFSFVLSNDSPLAICDSETCRWQITHGTGLPSVHPIELIAAAYGAPIKKPLSNILKSHH